MLIGRTDTTEHVCIVAEIGGNHNGDPETAYRLIREAARAGANAVKFQSYRAETLVHPSLEAMPLARVRFKRQFDRFKSLEFSAEVYTRLVALCRELDIDFMTTPFEVNYLQELKAHMVAVKIASGDLTYHPLIRAAAATGKPVILSTGMATREEILAAAALVPLPQLAVLHCVSLYPLPDEKANLLSIPILTEMLPGAVVGYSDHTIGPEASLAAVALGARVIEKHFTLDPSQELGDHRLSLDPEGMAHLVHSIRRLELMLGQRDKKPAEGEADMRRLMRRGIYAARALNAGTVISEDDLLYVRPETDLTPASAGAVVGRRLQRHIAALEAFDLGVAQAPPSDESK